MNYQNESYLKNVNEKNRSRANVDGIFVSRYSNNCFYSYEKNVLVCMQQNVIFTLSYDTYCLGVTWKTFF